MSRDDRWTDDDDALYAAQVRAEQTVDEIARITGTPRDQFTVHTIERRPRVRWWQPGGTLTWTVWLLLVGAYDLTVATLRHSPAAVGWVGGAGLFASGFGAATWIYRHSAMKAGHR